MNRRTSIKLMAMAATVMPMRSFGDLMKKKIPVLLQGISTIHCTGDSLTDGSSYPDYLVNTINTVCGTSITMQNSGVGGNTVRMLRNRLSDDVLMRKPDLVTVCIGTNDFFQKVPRRDFKVDLESVVDSLQKARIKVMLITPSHLADGDADQRLLEYCGIVQQIAISRHLPCADAHTLFIEWNKKGKKMIDPDGIHHDRDGFIGMACAALDALGLQNEEVYLTIKPASQTLVDWEVSAPLATTKAYRKPLDPFSITEWVPFDRAAANAQLLWWEQHLLQRGALMPVAAHRPAQNLMAFGRAIHTAKKSGSAQLLLGGSHPQQVWLNGVKVFERVRFHGIHPDADRMAVTLVAGANEIIVATEALSFVGILV